MKITYQKAKTNNFSEKYSLNKCQTPIDLLKIDNKDNKSFNQQKKYSFCDFYQIFNFGQSCQNTKFKFQEQAQPHLSQNRNDQSRFSKQICLEQYSTNFQSFSKSGTRQQPQSEINETLRTMKTCLNDTFEDIQEQQSIDQINDVIKSYTIQTNQKNFNSQSHDRLYTIEEEKSEFSHSLRYDQSQIDRSMSPSKKHQEQMIFWNYSTINKIPQLQQKFMSSNQSQNKQDLFNCHYGSHSIQVSQFGNMFLKIKENQRVLSQIIDIQIKTSIKKDCFNSFTNKINPFNIAEKQKEYQKIVQIKEQNTQKYQQPKIKSKNLKKIKIMCQPNNKFQTIK